MYQSVSKKEGFGEVRSKRQAGKDEGPSFDVKHLKTYTTEPTDPVPVIKDAIQLLSKQKNLRTHDYRLAIRFGDEENVVSLYDYWIGEQEAERIPIKFITDAQSQLEGVQEEFDNLLLFRVEPSPYTSPAHELHIFKVLRTSAEDAVSALVRAGARRGHIYNGEMDWQSQKASKQLPPPGPSDSQRSTYSHADRGQPHQDSGSTLRRNSVFDFRQYSDTEFSSSVPAHPEEINTDWLKAEVSLLNNLFDEIEENIHIIRDRPNAQLRRLSVIASMSKSSGKSWSKTTASKAGTSQKPQASDQDYQARVVDFFQKTKFVCILLSRISDYVKEPQAPVLIRNVFSLLREGYRLCSESNTSGRNPAHMVHQPRLPRETLNFLNTHLTAAQRSLLTELGSAWTTPREETNDQEVYIPTFRKNFKVNVEDYEPSLFRYKELGADYNPERRYIRKVKLDAFAEQLMDERLHSTASPKITCACISVQQTKHKDL
ncbi:unnamed protein product [Dicrocoelium dendriticum]|nr:unnamed protein product [Dicrocoelium dendriticum]